GARGQVLAVLPRRADPPNRRASEHRSARRRSLRHKEQSTMIIDHFLKVSRDQAVTASAPSTDVIDFGQPNPNTGLHDRLDMVITVGDAATAAGEATVTFSIQDSDDGTNFDTVVSSPATPIADLGAGAQVILPMTAKHRRYVRVNYA